MKEFIPWSKAMTFEEYVVSLIKDGKTKSPEFMALRSFHGDEKLKRIWFEHKAKAEQPKLKIRDGRMAATGEKDDD